LIGIQSKKQTRHPDRRARLWRISMNDLLSKPTEEINVSEIAAGRLASLAAGSAVAR
jgi:hypothetical protein